MKVDVFPYSTNFSFSMTGEQIQAPSSPRDGEDISITQGHPKVPLFSH